MPDTHTPAPAWKIEKGVSLPEKRGAIRKYPFYDMDVGDSVFCLGLTGKRANSCVSYIAKTQGSKWTTRSVTENGAAGVRVWRIS